MRMTDRYLGGEDNTSSASGGLGVSIECYLPTLPGFSFANNLATLGRLRVAS